MRVQPLVVSAAVTPFLIAIIFQKLGYNRHIHVVFFSIKVNSFCSGKDGASTGGKCRNRYEASSFASFFCARPWLSGPRALFSFILFPFCVDIRVGSPFKCREHTPVLSATTLFPGESFVETALARLAKRNDPPIGGRTIVSSRIQLPCKNDVRPRAMTRCSTRRSRKYPACILEMTSFRMTSRNISLLAGIHRPRTRSYATTTKRQTSFWKKEDSR